MTEMIEWATFRIHGSTFRIRRGASEEEPRLVVEPLEADCPPGIPRLLTTLANARHPELQFAYVPNRCAAVAEILAKNANGEFLDYNRPSNELIPEGIVF